MNGQKSDTSPTFLFIIFFIDILLIIPWFPFAALSAMAYDSGNTWPAIIIVGPFHAYPAFVLISIILSIVYFKLEKMHIALMVAIAPPLISLGWGLLAIFIMYTFEMVFKGL